LAPLFFGGHGLCHAPRIALGDLIRDVLVNLGLNVSVSAGADRNAARKLAGLLEAPDVDFGISDALIAKGVVRDKAGAHWTNLSVLGARPVPFAQIHRANKKGETPGKT
jgi:hypothetical protein